MTDPDRAVAGAHEDGAVATGDDRTGFGGRRGRADTPAVGVEDGDRGPAQTGDHPGCAIGGTDAAQHVLGGIRPVETAVGLADRGPRPSADAGPRVVQRLRHESGVDRLGHHLVHQRHGGVGHRPVVERALARHVRVEREGAGRPDRAGVQLLHRLQGGDPPDGLGVHDRPVQGRRAAIALRTRVDHDRGACVPDLGGHAFA